MADWYGVKIIYRIKVHGPPKRKDRFYRPRKRTYYEESVRLVQADSFEQAYDRAALAAKDNCESYTNKYGQVVTTSIYAVVDCYLGDSTVESGSEVFSCIYREKEGIGKKALLKKRYQTCRRKEMHMLRNLRFSGGKIAPNKKI